MSAPVSVFDPLAERLRPVPAFVRAASEVRLGLVADGKRTSARSLFETGGLRVRFPRAGGACEGVLINTGGGIAGGDRVKVGCTLSPRAAATLTTQSAEKIYRAETISSRIEVSLTLEARARLAWLPQETILFDGARLTRTLDVQMARDASVTILETLVFGRLARNERLGVGLLHDRWRVRRDGQLVFAEDVRLDGQIANLLERPACGGGALAVATLLHIDAKAETRLSGLRRQLTKARSDCGASAFNGLLVARFAAVDPVKLRADVRRAAEYILRGAVPRVWSF